MAECATSASCRRARMAVRGVRGMGILGAFADLVHVKAVQLSGSRSSQGPAGSTTEASEDAEYGNTIALVRRGQPYRTSRKSTAQGGCHEIWTVDRNLVRCRCRYGVRLRIAQSAARRSSCSSPGPASPVPDPASCRPDAVVSPMAIAGRRPHCPGLVLQARGASDPLGRGRYRHVRFGAVDGAGPLQLPSGRHLSPEADQHGAAAEGVELYPTIEIGPTTPRTAAFLAHNAIPVEFTEEDFDQVLAGNFVTKVIYLPDPEFQELAVAGVGTLVSTRLDPGVDPIVEADRQGAIMAVVRLGNKDMEMPGSGIGMGGVMAGGMMGGVGTGVGMGQPCGPDGGMMGGAMPGAALAAAGMGGGPLPQYVAGVSSPMWGMPTCGTPIGLPGPPHIPLGIPAGLQKHKIRNYTPTHLPKPTRAVRVHVRQQPGYSYPRPPSRVFIREQNIHPSSPFKQPFTDKHQRVDTQTAPGCQPASCQTGNCPQY